MIILKYQPSNGNYRTDKTADFYRHFTLIIYIKENQEAKNNDKQKFQII